MIILQHSLNFGYALFNHALSGNLSYYIYLIQIGLKIQATKFNFGDAEYKP